MTIPSKGKSKGKSNSVRRTIVDALTIVSHASTPFINTFLLIHLAAPIVANIGGTNLASRTMLLGREYYQTPIGEKYLALGPIVVHALAGITKRLLSAPSIPEKRSGASSGNNALPYRPLKSLLGLTGYATSLILLPIHFLVHRDYPALPTEPIVSVGPSSLDYEYVKYGLHNWPWRSWLLYAGLVSAVALHAADGATLIWNTWLKDSWLNVSRRTRRRAVISGIIFPVILGLVAIAREPPMIMSFLQDRYHAAFTRSLVFRI